MKRLLQTIIVTSAVVAATGTHAAADGSLMLVENGQPKATIILATNATCSAQFAAFELREHVRRITGAELVITNELAPVSGARIFVGPSQASEALGLPGPALGPQEYLVAFRTNALALLGRDAPNYRAVKYDANDPFAFGTWPDFYEEHATCYAVYDFLERFCNVRWFRPGEIGTVTPQNRTLVVSGADVRGSPEWKYRQPSYATGNSEIYDVMSGLWESPKHDSRYAEMDRLAFPNLQHWGYGSGNYIHAKRGEMRLFLHRLRTGGEPYACNHSFYGFYDRFWGKAKDPERAKRFVEKKPKWFAQGYEGLPPQMCYSSKEFVRQVVQDARDYFDGKGMKPGAQAAGDYFGIEPMDNDSYCKCARCQAQVDSEAATNTEFSTGKWSEYWFGFVNQVAREIRKSHPDKFISTLAYAGHAYPPKKIKLEPNVTVGFCLHMRNIWGKSLQENDVALFKAWADNNRGRRFFLFPYYCFPAENAQCGRFHCFPGFFAHGIGAWFQRFHEAGVRGAYFCGWGQDVEAYVTGQLWNDSTRNVDAILNDYFTRYYGAAAQPMRDLYLAIERIYSTPESYPPGFRSHQTEQIAWENLGAEPRMRQLAELMEAARRAATTDIEKQRVALFEQSTWDYMVAGRKLHWAREAQRLPRGSRFLRVTPLAEPVAGQDPAKIAWPSPSLTDTWQTECGEPTGAPMNVRLTHDNRNLYVQFNDPAGVPAAAGWEMIFAGRPALPAYRLRVSPNGECAVSAYGDRAAWTCRAVATVAPSSDGGRTATIRVPFDDLLPGGVEAGWHFWANLVRRASDGNHWVWRPNVVGAEEPEWLGTIHLDGPPGTEAVPRTSVTGPKRLPPVEIAAGATVETVDVVNLNFAPTNALHGRPFVVETNGVYVHHRNQCNAPEGNKALTDAWSARAPVDDLIAEGVPEVSLRWDLGPVPAEGRKLKALRAWWSMEDGARNGIHAKFAVRDAKDGTWRETGGYLTVPPEASVGNTYKVLTLDGAILPACDFDAVRMTDARSLTRQSNTRWVEIEVITAPADKP
ncbi:MAG: DUF4838 domain-containing protein [Kiritimatiellae bacterium]|nr:DUF4838 domain-containing protein [Kiritimatiellia bacterium]